MTESSRVEEINYKGFSNQS